jgi:hypothetical protein
VTGNDFIAALKEMFTDFGVAIRVHGRGRLSVSRRPYDQDMQDELKSKSFHQVTMRAASSGNNASSYLVRRPHESSLSRCFIERNLRRCL